MEIEKLTKKNSNHLLQWCFPILTLIFLSLGTRAQLHDIYRLRAPLFNDTLSCLIMPKDMYQEKYYPLGYHYQILKEFVKEKKRSLYLSPLPDSTSVWEALLAKRVRVVVLDAAQDTIPEEIAKLVMAGPSLNSKEHVWVYREDDFDMMHLMHTWFNSFKYTSEYAEITSRFFREEGNNDCHQTKRAISPYDELIQEYSKTLGWDWRLLAALIRQESSFRMGATSPKGATGLMQMMPNTAEKFGAASVSELFDPEENIKVGTRYLKEIARLLRDSLLVGGEQIKFILAAYNAGPEQIKDCRNFAEIQGKNPNSWSDVASVIPLMREDENAHLVVRSFKGDETLRYVEEVLARYERYQEVYLLQR